MPQLFAPLAVSLMIFVCTFAAARRVTRAYGALGGH